MKVFNLKILFCVILSISLMSCSSKKEGKTDVKVSFLGIADMTGGLMVFGESDFGDAFSQVITGVGEAVILPNGLWRFAAIGWDGANIFEGQIRCGTVEGVVLSGGETDVGFVLSSANCAEHVFGPASTKLPTGEPYPATFINCSEEADIKNHNISCNKGLAKSYQFVLHSFALGPQGGVALAPGLVSACIDDNDGTAIVEGMPAIKMPMFDDDFPISFTIEAYDNPGCTGSLQPYFFSLGGFQDPKQVDNHSNGSNNQIFLLTEFCRSPHDGVAAIFSSGAYQAPPAYNHICNGDQLTLVAANPGGHYKLDQDVDLSGVPDFETYMIPTFSGEFLGQGYTISNLSLTAAADDAGFFETVSSGTVRDLNFYGANIDGVSYDNIGVAIGRVYGTATIENINVSNSSLVDGFNAVGGAIGAFNGAIWSVKSLNVSLTTISASSTLNQVGGVVGNIVTVAGAEIKDLYSDYNTIDLTSGAPSQIGGVIGRGNWVAGTLPLTNLFATGVTINIQNAVNVGGVIGDLTMAGGTEKLMFAKGSGIINLSGSASTKVGGVVGYASNGEIHYALGDVYIDEALNATVSFDVGGVAGRFDGGTQIFTSKGITDINCPTCFGVGGLIGMLNAGSANMSGATGSIVADDDVGGFIGKTGPSVALDRCYAEGDITASGDDAGGLVGEHAGGNISSCYALGDVSANDNGGGFIGITNGGGPMTITTSYAFGSATATTQGGFVASDPGPADTFTGNYYNSSANGGAGAAGAGSPPNPLTTTQLTDSGSFGTNYSGFNIPDDWDGANGEGALQLKIFKTFDDLGGYHAGGQIDPFEICTPDNWNAIKNNDFLMGQTFLIVCPIDFGGGSFEMIGDISYPFTGQIRGNNMTLSNIDLSAQTGNGDIGIIRVMNGGSVAHFLPDGGLARLYIDNIIVDGGDRVGSLVGYMQAVKDIHGVEVLSGSITGTGNEIGGLVGQVAGSATSGSISENRIWATVGGASSNNVGGLVGDVVAASNVTYDRNETYGGVSGNGQVGGMFGNFAGGTVNQSASFNMVTGSGNDIGGFVGNMTAGTINESFSGDEFSSVTISGNNNVGGFIGSMTGGPNINDSYAVYDVSGVSIVGGFVGLGTTGTINRSYTYGQTLTGGTEGFRASGGATLTNCYTHDLNGATGVTALTETQMFQEASYTGFDFDLVWDIDEDFAIPKHKWYVDPAYP